MSITKLLSDQLQSENLDLASAGELVLSTINTLMELRSDERWEQTFRYINDVATLHNIEPDDRRYRKRWQCTDFTDTPIAHWELLNSSQSLKVILYFPVIDHILTEMKQRFSKTQLAIMKGVKALHLNSFHFLQVSDLSAMASFYGLLETTLVKVQKVFMLSTSNFILFRLPFPHWLSY